MVKYNMPFVKDVLARAYWKKGELDNAVSEYERLTTIDPKSPTLMLISPLYHYRLVATNSLGTTRGADSTLTTIGPPSGRT